VASGAGPGRDEQAAVDGFGYLFVFDGDCGFCRKWAAWLEHRVGTAIRFLPFQALDDLARFGLTIEDVQSASYLIENGDAYRGGRGFARALIHSQGKWRPVGLFLDLPGVRLASAIAYRLIARNRHRLPAPHDDDAPAASREPR
jgi:predicted DCC family thiol-disulfide oxidoreductase YuxK